MMRLEVVVLEKKRISLLSYVLNDNMKPYTMRINTKIIIKYKKSHYCLPNKFDNIVVITIYSNIFRIK